MAALLLVLLLNLNLDMGIYHDDPVPCPVRLYCSEDKTNILELPAFPSSVKLPVTSISYTSNTLQVYDPKHCFPQLFLTLNYSSFYPFQSIKQSLDFDSFYDPLHPTNCTFFDCSSSVPPNILSGYYEEQDLLSCPILIALDDDNIIESNLVLCTKLTRHVLPISVCKIQWNWEPLYLVWSTETFKSGCFVACNVSNNGTEHHESVLLPLTGDDTYIPIDDDGDFRIAKKLAIVGLWCIQWHPVHRPSMKSVVQMLEAEEDKLKVPPNPFESIAATSSSAIIPARFLNLELEVIPETD
ncbi:hypothetical protein Ahy_B06g086037 [Arachis hypogaea]|uniref:RING-type E3 ubiquitin transferase n=1 Tax=Arachis hypogaea TaxID=3818 RepID=A0A444YWI8_ARAHY|nr:hypothetical protein Ahy_B06g086037 [Arachis hypogaea]